MSLPSTNSLGINSNNSLIYYRNYLKFILFVMRLKSPKTPMLTYFNSQRVRMRRAYLERFQLTFTRVAFLDTLTNPNLETTFLHYNSILTAISFLSPGKKYSKEFYLSTISPPYISLYIRDFIFTWSIISRKLLRGKYSLRYRRIF